VWCCDSSFDEPEVTFYHAELCSWVPINYVARCLSPDFYQEFVISSKLVDVVSGRTLETDAVVDLASLATQSINQASHPGKP
jgi:hypothetical protein